MPFEKDENEIGALWAKTSAKGNEFMSGTIDGMDVVCFRNTKKTSEKQPDWRVLKSKPRESRFELLEPSVPVQGESRPPTRVNRRREMRVVAQQLA